MINYIFIIVFSILLAFLSAINRDNTENFKIIRQKIYPIKSFPNTHFPKKKYPILSFPDINSAKKILSTSDGYTKSLGKFDLQSKLQSQSENLKEKDYLNTVENNVRVWNIKDKEKINLFYDKLKTFFYQKNIVLQFPPVINIIQTTGKEEGGASGYVRGNTIIMKSIKDDKMFEELFYHEMWHIFTNYDQNLAKFVYSRYQFFFDKSRKLIIPPEIKDYRITNPDLYGRDGYFKASLNKKVLEFYPMLISNEKYTTGSFFKYLYVVLFAVENNGNTKIFKKNSSGDYIILKVIRFSKNAGNKFRFLNNLEEKKIGFSVEKILGYNTPYVLGHPEESLAEMFKFLVSEDWQNKDSSELISSLLNDLINYKSIQSNTFNI